MAISVANFPLCCTARVIYNFGGGHAEQIEDYSKKEAIVAIKDILRAYRSICATVVAIPTSTQPNAYAALEELGFYAHPDGIDGGGDIYGSGHKMCCMFLPLKEWDEKAFDERYDPEKDDYVDGTNHGVSGTAKPRYDVFG